MSKIVQIYSLTAGVGRTSFTINLAGELSKNFDKRILLLDFDELSCSTNDLVRVKKPVMYFSDMLVSYFEEGVLKDFHAAISKTNFKGLDIVPSERKKMDNSIRVLSDCNYFEATSALEPFLKQIEDEYDIILVDSSANERKYDFMAMCQADYVIIPVDDDIRSTKRAKLSIEEMLKCKNRLNLNFDFIGICLNRMHNRWSLSKQVKIELSEEFHDKFIPAVIRASVTVGDAAWKYSPLCYAYPSSAVSKDYHQVASYILDYIEKAH